MTMENNNPLETEDGNAAIDPAPVGRPRLPYDAEIGERICIELAEGKSLVQVMTAPGMPSRRTIYNWLQDSPDFVLNYTRAREEQADYFADECTEIADASVGLDAAGVAAMRLRYDSRRWRAGTLKPKVYGNNSNVAVGGDENNKEPIKLIASVTVDALIREKLKTFVVSPTA